MAGRRRIRARTSSGVTLRVANPEWQRLSTLLRSRYPNGEWATFARFGWRETAHGLVLTLAALDEPTPGDMDDRVAHVAIQEQYSLRVALGAERHGLAVGVVHSHPKDFVCRPSEIDDDMDGYYAGYLSGFAVDRPFISVIVADQGDQPVLSGRTWWRGEWLEIERVTAPAPTRTWGPGGLSQLAAPRARTARLNSALGLEAAGLLRGARVAVIGAGGTGSPAIGVLARAGLGGLVIVDPDELDESNLERVHGADEHHPAKGTPKALVAKAHVLSIDPTCDVEAIVGRIPQPEVVDAVVRCDVVLGCTDQQHSRLALSELAFRYLVPIIDCGVCLEGQKGHLTGQVAQLVRFLPADPCALCQKMIDPQRVTQELLDPDERERRRQAAKAAQDRGERPDPYWLDEAQLHTVGYLTTAVGALAAGYAIGLITGRFAVPFGRLQANFGAPFWDVTDQNPEPSSSCTCRAVRGWGDQGAAFSLISAPTHWPQPVAV